MVADTTFTIPGYDLELPAIGLGGFGRVYRAREISTLRHVRAVKVIDSSPFVDRGKSLARFRREAAALSRIDHPNVVKYVASGTTADAAALPYLVTDFVEGQVFRSDAALTDIERIHVMIDVLSALDHTHRMGLFHRDIKPSNVMVRASKKSACILDFGLAFDIDDREFAELTSRYAGSLGYVPPEVQIGQQPSRANHDVFSCGMTLYEALVGTKPNIQDYVPLASHRKTLSPLDPVIRKAIDSIERRYRSAADFGSELRNVLSKIEAIDGIVESNPQAEALRLKAIEKVQLARQDKEERARAQADLEAQWSRLDEIVRAGGKRAFEDMVPAAQELYQDSSIVDPSKGDQSTPICILRHGPYFVRLGYSTKDKTRIANGPPLAMPGNSETARLRAVGGRTDRPRAHLDPQWIVYSGEQYPPRGINGAISAVRMGNGQFQLLAKPLVEWRGTIGHTPKEARALASAEDVKEYITRVLGAYFGLDR